MNGTAHDNYPQLCSEVGLTCTSCTSTTARELAAVCKGLVGKMVGQLFVQIYPSSACAPMHSHFAACYKEESSVQEAPPVQGTPDPLPARREVMFARPRAMRAVA
jgi:hypothetical protein